MELCSSHCWEFFVVDFFAQNIFPSHLFCDNFSPQYQNFLQTSGEAGEFEVLNFNAALTLAKIVCFKVVIKIFLFLFFAVFFSQAFFNLLLNQPEPLDVQILLLVGWLSGSDNKINS